MIIAEPATNSTSLNIEILQNPKAVPTMNRVAARIRIGRDGAGWIGEPKRIAAGVLDRALGRDGLPEHLHALTAAAGLGVHHLRAAVDVRVILDLPGGGELAGEESGGGCDSEKLKLHFRWQEDTQACCLVQWIE